MASQSTAQIEKSIEQTRARLAATIDELAYRVKPANLAKRQVEQAKASFASATQNEQGGVRYEVVVPVVAAVVGLVAIAIIRRARA